MVYSLGMVGRYTLGGVYPVYISLYVSLYTRVGTMPPCIPPSIPPWVHPSTPSGMLSVLHVRGVPAERALGSDWEKPMGEGP